MNVEEKSKKTKRIRHKVFNIVRSNNRTVYMHDLTLNLYVFCKKINTINLSLIDVFMISLLIFLDFIFIRLLNKNYI